MILTIELIVYRKYQKEIQMCSRKVQTGTNRFFLVATPSQPYAHMDILTIFRNVDLKI